MPALIYSNGKISLNTYDWTSGLYSILLAGPSYVPNAITHSTIANVTNELSGSNYARKQLVNPTRTLLGPTLQLAADNLTWIALQAGLPIGWAILFVEVGLNSGNPLIAALQIGNVVSDGSDFLVKWSGGTASGALLDLFDT